MRTAKLLLVALAIAGATGPTAPDAADALWGAYAGYHFDHTQGDEGYGVAWNYPDPEQAIEAALRQCHERQPPAPEHTPEQLASGAHPGRRCGDRVFAFSSVGPDPEEVVAIPDPSWSPSFERLTVHRRHRCTGVVELSDHPAGFEVLGSNFHRIEGDTQAAVQALVEKWFSGKDRGPHAPFPNPYRTAIIACNDQ